MSDGHAEETIINNLFNPNTGVQEWGIVEGGISVGGPGIRSSKNNSPWRIFWRL
jgi:hypothetical protein